ncbi:MAG: histidinol dehydrogenase, partial [Bacteroidaceae bacterium]|nr:histidinol dehydrogenase [Bacteroidaceae bacterium]
MKYYKFPTEEELGELLKRPVRDAEDLNATVRSVLCDVRQRGDEAVREYEERFDHVRLETFSVTEQEMVEAEALVSDE